MLCSQPDAHDALLGHRHTPLRTSSCPFLAPFWAALGTNARTRRRSQKERPYFMLDAPKYNFKGRSSLCNPPLLVVFTPQNSLNGQLGPRTRPRWGSEGGSLAQGTTTTTTTTKNRPYLRLHGPNRDSEGTLAPCNPQPLVVYTPNSPNAHLGHHTGLHWWGGGVGGSAKRQQLPHTTSKMAKNILAQKLF